MAKKRQQTDRSYDFMPKSKDDLAMHKNRVSDISNWIDEASTQRRATFLLLTGPAGSGKMTTVKVLAAEKGIVIIEWITPMDAYSVMNIENMDWLQTIPAVNQFKNFLHRAGRYSSVMGELTTNKRLIVVKDFPTALVSSSDEFREIIDHYASHCSTPIVFICTDSPNKRSTDIAYELFPESFKQKHKIIHMTANAISTTNMVKGLKRVLTLLKESSQSSEKIAKQVAEESGGDIRKAINNLVVKIVGDTKKSKTVGVKGKKKVDKTRKKSKMEAEDENVGLFHAVGRVLYAKRELSSETGGFKETSVGEFVHKPMDIVDQYSHYASQFINLAHSNYLDIFSDIESIAKAADCLSQSDVIMAEWREKEVLNVAGFGIAVIGLMEANRDPVRKWKPLRGNQWTEDIRSAKTNQDRVRELFSEVYVSKLDLFTDYVPVMSQLWYRRSGTRPGSMACKYGFLPHDTASMVSMVEKMKADMCTSHDASFAQDDDEDNVNRPDTPIHISDDSD